MMQQRKLNNIQLLIRDVLWQTSKR